MSEEVTNVTLQVTEKAVTTGLNATTRIAEMFARLFRELMAMSRERNASKAGRGNISGSKEKVKETDLTDLKPGYAALRDLEKSAQKTGDTIATSEHGMSREDMKAVCHKAKKYGIPVAFKNPKGKDNIYACVRGSDLPIFKQICTEVIQDKIAVAPEKLGNFKCEEWEMPFLTAEMKNLDVAAMFPSSAQGSFCLYVAKDEKLIRCAREEFAKKYAALERDVAIAKDEQGFYSITDKRTGKSVTFDEIPTRKKLSEQIQAQFGFDENKANMCVAKFAQEMLHGADRERLVSPKVQEEFSNIGSMVELDGEHPLASHYQCWHLKPKDDVSRIVFRDGESGQFAILDPLKMSDKKMRAVLTEQLGITDKDMLHALTDKADRLAQHYEREVAANYMDNHSFHLDDFKPEELVEHKTVGASGQEYVTKLKPIDSVEQTIDRSGRNAYGAPDRDAFTLDVKFTASAPSADGKTIETSTSSTTLELSLADKKTGMNILTEMYKEHGIPEATAREMAKSVFKKAEMQSPERVVRLEEVRAETMKVVYGTQSAEVSTADRQSAAQKIAEQFGIPVEAAQEIVEKAEDAKRAAQDTPQETEAQDAKKTAAADTDAQPDAETDSRGEGERKPTEAKPAPGDDAKPDASQSGNGHEKHRAPTQDALDALADAAAPTDSQPVSSQSSTARKPDWKQYFSNPQILADDRQFDGTSHLKKSPTGGSFLLSDPLPDGTFYVMLRRDKFTGEYPFYESGTNVIDQYFNGAKLDGGQITDMTPARVKPVPFHEGEFEVVEKGTITQEDNPKLTADTGAQSKPPAEINGQGHHPIGAQAAAGAMPTHGAPGGAMPKPDVPKPAPRRR